MASEKKTLKREKIIATAIDMLEHKSYNEIRVEDITKELKMAKSMFFYYFDAKAVLYLEIMHKLHKNLIASFIQEIENTDIGSCEDFRQLIMYITDIYINNHLLLIRLLEYEEMIYGECSCSQVTDFRDKISNLYDSLHNKILDKFTFFTKNEIFYVFEVQMHLLRGYYRQMVGITKYYAGDRKDLVFERKSVYEYRVMRTLRYFIAGIIYEKDIPKMP